MSNHEKNLQDARDFLKICDQFKLGSLPTENPNPLTVNLSNDAKRNLPKAIETLQKIDLDVFNKLDLYLDSLQPLAASIRQTISSGRNIYLCGCGATGRLSLALETIWRFQNNANVDLQNRVISFIAGGDVALIHSIEKFEDYPEYGERQLLDLGFQEGDLLISCTEGGETPFVIGATEAALQHSSRSPFFLYCNPDDILINTAERSKRVISNSNIHKVNLTTGPMALTGSTRMQATTILMYAVGLCLWYYDKDFLEVRKELKRMIEFFKKNDFQFLNDFIEEESEIYKKYEYVLYETDSLLGISILTDTTERSPTFSLYPFENQLDKIKSPSLSYLYFPKSIDTSQAWQSLLGRAPRTFLWDDVTNMTSESRLLGFDFSQNLITKRQSYLNANYSIFKIYFDLENKILNFHLNDKSYQLATFDMNFLSIHILLKLILNTHSTLVMGRLDRYESNLMTWVRASNNKLIDRAIRYADLLLNRLGHNVPYETLAIECFKLKDITPRDQSLVLEIVKSFST